MSLKRMNVLVLLFALAGGCATKVVPPANPANPVTVYVTDFGRHSTILLPMGDGHLMEYAYGDWDYFALNKYRWYIGATALVASDASGLGRRVVAHPGSDEALKKMLNPKRLLSVQVEHSKVMALLNELDQRYSANIETMVYNDYTKSYFVKDVSHYWLFHTCNAMTAQWLEKLGCRVNGLAVVSNFQVDRPRIEPLKPAKEPEVQYARGIPSTQPVQLSQQQVKDISKRSGSSQQVSLRQQR